MAMKTSLSARWALLVIVFAVALAGCGVEPNTPEQSADPRRGATKPTYTPPKNPLPPPEPADAPPLERKPAGRVIGVGLESEGLVADPDTGLVAVGVRDPDGLALVDGVSAEVVRRVELPGSLRHLNIAGPGGPVLVPAESSDSLVQVGLPGGELLEKTPVGNFPHDAAATPGDRVFVVNEAASTASVVEDGDVIATIDTPPGPGGVAVTESGLVGIVGVRGLALEVFEADTLDSLGRIDAGKGPTHVEVGPGDRFYVADTRGGAVLVYEARPEPVLLERVDLPGSPYGLAIDHERGHLWVTLTAENRLVQYAFGGGALREIATYPTVRQPNTVAVDPESGRVFVAGRAEGRLQILRP